MKIFKTAEKFQWYVGYLSELKKDFYVIRGKTTKTAIWNKKRMFGGRYRSSKNSTDKKYLWVYAKVVRDCNDFLKEKNPQTLKFKYRSLQKNKIKINEILAHTKFYATDIDHCFWRIMFREGYISEKTYKRLLADRDDPNYSKFKDIRNKAMGSINSNKVIDIYEKGKFVETKQYRDPRLKIIYKDVRNKSFEIMDRARKACGKGFIGYRTDCIWYDLEYKEIVEKILTESGVGFKTEQCSYIEEGYYTQGRDIKNLL